MSEESFPKRAFEAERKHLRGVAYRVLGNASDAEDAVQEAWLRLSNAAAQGIGNSRAWLTTVTGRICFDMLRARRSRREEPDGRCQSAVAMRGVIAATIVWTLARFAFWIGYHVGPQQRIAGLVGSAQSRPRRWRLTARVSET